MSHLDQFPSVPPLPSVSVLAGSLSSLLESSGGRTIAEASERLPEANGAMLISCGAALACLVPVLLHQTGVLAHLPDPAGTVFDSDGITSSTMAHPLGIPDAALGLGSYGVTLALMLAGGSYPPARALLAGKLVADGSVATFNTVRQVVRFGKLCSWCMGTVVATAVMVWSGRKLVQAAVAEGSAALRPRLQLAGGKRSA